MEELLKDFNMLVYGYMVLSGYVSTCDNFNDLKVVLGINMLSLNKIIRLSDEFENMVRHEQYYSQCLREGKSIQDDINNCGQCKYYMLKNIGLITDEDCDRLCYKER